jgi:hypothetical protein
MAIRLAKPADLSATSRIAFRGFSLSPWNPFYRPRAKQFPEDVQNSYLYEQQEALGNDRKIFSVIEVPAGEKQEIVGFAIWNLTASQPSKVTPVKVDLVQFKG